MWRANKTAALRRGSEELATLGQRPAVPGGPYLIVGLGRAGLSAASALSDRMGASQVRACDRITAAGHAEAVAALRARGVQIDSLTDGVRMLVEDGPAGCVVKSPGVPFDAPVIVRALEAGVPVLDELELGWRLCSAPMIGVTGTNGKSTVCALIAAAAGAEQVVGNAEFGPPMSAVASASHDLIVCEVSSYQLEGCPELLPEAAVLTNLRPDHLQRHRSLQEYGECKRKLFVRGARTVGLAVVNADDEFGRSLAVELGQGGGDVLRFGRTREAEFRLRDCGWTLRTAWLEADTPDGGLRIRHRLPGIHNAENVLAAVAAARGLGFDWEAILPAIEQAGGVPGRFEPIDEGQPFDVVVDFAHTPDAIEAVLGAAREVCAARQGRILAVVSVAGHRSGELNAPIGAATACLADLVVVTEGSLRAGSAATTIEPLFDGARAEAAAPVELIRDRRLAIRAMLSIARSNDIVLLLGRGARPRLSRDLSGDGPAFDDRVVAREELRLLRG